MDVTVAQIEAFGEVSGDKNPVHFDDEYAAGTVFGGRVAHGMLMAGLLSAVIGEELPGYGSIYLGQTMKFKAPVRPGDTVIATVKVLEVNRVTGRVQLDCVCKVGETVVVSGEATVLAPRKNKAKKAA
ncbi:MAG: MaoC family dehydratase [Neomegalonema sp.]|nr:MaoC family dehydratase [Neomegalonema sp.]